MFCFQKWDEERLGPTLYSLCKYIYKSSSQEFVLSWILMRKPLSVRLSLTRDCLRLSSWSQLAHGYFTKMYAQYDKSWRCLFFYFPKFLLFISMYKHWRWAVWDTCTVLMHIVLAYSVSVSIVYSLLLRWALLFWHSSDMCESESTLFQVF